MAITTTQEVLPDQTAREYAVKFQLPANDASVKWVREHQQEYLSLVRSKDKICNENGIDPDKFPVQINVDPVPNATVNGGVNALSTYLGVNVQDTVDFAHPIKINTGTLVPSMTDKDREQVLAHEIGHHTKMHSEVRQRQFLKDTFAKNFEWLKPTKDIVRDTSRDIAKDEESRADRRGAELTCDAQAMATALKHLGEIKLRLKTGQILSVEEINNSPNSDHPSIGSRIQALHTAAPEVEAHCRKR